MPIADANTPTTTICARSLARSPCLPPPRRSSMDIVAASYGAAATRGNAVRNRAPVAGRRRRGAEG